jgi:hypothetical protein
MDSNREKLVAVHSGGDWYDASADYVVVPVDLDVQKQYEAYRDWYQNVYRKSLVSREPDGPRTNVKYQSFDEWLAKAGRVAEDEDIEVFET